MSIIQNFTDSFNALFLTGSFLRCIPEGNIFLLKCNIYLTFRKICCINKIQKGIRSLSAQDIRNKNTWGSDDLKNLKMKAARAAKDLSQEELAQLVGVTRQTIGMIEAGKYNPTLNLCIAICKALDKTLDELFWEEDGE